MLVNDWHQQAQVHALDSEVAHLLIQIPRFQVTEEGAVHKHSLQLNLRSMQNIQIPVFVEPDTIAVRWVSFEVNSMVVHEGPTPQSVTIELLSCVRTGLGHSGIQMTGRGPSMRHI